MKKIVLAICLSSSTIACASEPVASGYGIDSYHGYVGVGYNHPFIELKGYHAVETDGVDVILGHNYKPWLDLEFRASTATGYKTVASDTVGAAPMSIKQNYNLVGLLKFKWQPIRFLELNLTTGLNYMALEKNIASTTQSEYLSNLVLGGGVGLNLSKHYSINADYQTYQRSEFLGSEKDTWSAANISFQYHF